MRRTAHSPEAAIMNDFMTDNDDPGDHTDSTDL